MTQDLLGLCGAGPNPDDDYCAECRGFRNLPIMDPVACTCDTDGDRDDPYDPEIVSVRPGERPRSETTIHLPGDGEVQVDG